MTAVKPVFTSENLEAVGRYICPDDAIIEALNAAAWLAVPLLVTGEPGVGKTALAYAAHAVWRTEPDQPLLQCVVRSDATARSLLYRFDNLRRFHDAQVAARADTDVAFPERYVELEALGYALQSEERRVVLIDEIDKAPRDLPNDLLRVVEDGQFEIPEVGEATVGPIRRHMGRSARGQGVKPLVIITSNAESQLPDAFLRRCLFVEIPMPTGPRLERIINLHLGGGARGLDGPPTGTPPQAVQGAMKVFNALREDALDLVKKPTTSELIAWLSALGAGYVSPGWAERLEAAAGGRWRELPLMAALVKVREDRNRLLGQSVRG